MKKRNTVSMSNEKECFMNYGLSGMKKRGYWGMLDRLARAGVIKTDDIYKPLEKG